MTVSLSLSLKGGDRDTVTDTDSRPCPDRVGRGRTGSAIKTKKSTEGKTMTARRTNYETARNRFEDGYSNTATLIYAILAVADAIRDLTSEVAQAKGRAA